MSRIRIINCENPALIMEQLPDREAQAADVYAVVQEILTGVKQEGDAALLRFTEQFDSVRLSETEVDALELNRALQSVDPKFVDLLRRARENILSYHRMQVRNGFTMDKKPGIMLGQRVTPLDRVGVYVPGGTASYPSTVLMDVIPAKIAGVGEIVMVTPPDPDGSISPNILAAAYVAGVDRVFKIGGAQAVAALSYGTQSVPRVDKIVGPGNTYVATAKRLVYGQVDIDMIAGPSEILVVADETANPAHVAADLLSQAEHDTLSASYFVTPLQTLAEQVRDEISIQLEKLPRREIAQAAIGHNSAIIVTQDLVQAAAVSNMIAPEHLELCVEDPFAMLSHIKHAGSIFLGKYAPEALGDYFAGPNHTLPTNGTARFSSPLSVDDFCKRSSVIYYSKDALREVANDVAAFARHEGLEAHARSVTIRFEGETDR